MKLCKFKRRVLKAAKLLTESGKWGFNNDHYEGVCWSLQHAFGLKGNLQKYNPLIKTFTEMTKPAPSIHVPVDAFWFGDSHIGSVQGEENKLVRLNALFMWAETCIAFKTYEEF